MVSWNRGRRTTASPFSCHIVVRVRGCRPSQPDRTGISGAGFILRVAGPGGMWDVSSMVEQSPVKRKDIGSSPIRPARSKPGLRKVQSCLLAGGLPSRQAVADTDTISPCVPEHMATAPWYKVHPAICYAVIAQQEEQPSRNRQVGSSSLPGSSMWFMPQKAKNKRVHPTGRTVIAGRTSKRRIRWRS